MKIQNYDVKDEDSNDYVQLYDFMKHEKSK